jgi:hypothetical protein
MAKESASPDPLQSYYDRKLALAHYGVKGMKWGVRHDPGHEGQQAKTKTIQKLDKKFEQNAASVHTWIKFHNKAADMCNSHDIDRINNKPEYKNADFTKPSPLRDKYYKEHHQAYLNNLEKVASSEGTNASGTKKYTIAVDDGGNWGITTVDVKHADPAPDFVVKVFYDAKGFITKLEPQEPSGELAHWGVKGMKWGVRKDRTPVEASIKEGVPGRRIKAEGGKHLPASDDAIAAVKAHQIARKSTTDALSNKELRALVDRMNLEQQYNQLNASGPRASAGRKFLNDYLQNGGKDKTMENITEGTSNVAKKVALLLPGSRAAQVGVEIGSTIARAYVNKISGGKKK